MDRVPACARPGCAAPAVAVLSYSYAERQAWVDDLAGGDEVEPSSHPLCPAHADGFRVPRGWSCQDRRHGPAARYQRPIAV